MKGPILVVMAAGIGSRYGGLKQMEKIGANGEVLLDYSVFDALRGGFNKIVFIIRRDIEKDFKELILKRIEGKVHYELAYQELDSLLPEDIALELKKNGRTKPWGTAHALLCAADKLDAPFTVINSDDFYGREAFDAMGKYLGSKDITDAAIVPYKLETTLSPQGTVARGVCEIENNYLISVDELTAIEKKDNKIFNTAADGSIRSLEAETPVSMNFWGFPASIIPHFKTYFNDFLSESGKEAKSECYIPKAADWFIKNNIIKIKSLNADSKWFGITYKEDLKAAINYIEELIEKGVYPKKLW